MSYSPLAIKRKQVLGNIYKYCDTVESIPVYLNDASSGEMLGYVDESLGPYADAFLFHLPEDICKKLSTNYYNYIFDYNFFDSEINQKARIVLKHIVLTSRGKPS